MKMNWDYIAGFYDGEGSCSLLKRKSKGMSYRIDFSQVDIRPLIAIKDFLLTNKIYATLGYHTPKKHIARLHINCYRDVLKFIESIKDKVIVKKEKLEQSSKIMIDNPVHHIKLRPWQKDEVEIMMINKVPYKQIQLKYRLKSDAALLRLKKQRTIPNY